MRDTNAVPIIELKLPEIKGNTLLFSWTPNRIFKENAYWVQYPDLEAIEASEGKLAESLFPLCAAFAAAGARIVLPVKISEDVLQHWRRAIQITAMECFRQPICYSIQNGAEPPQYRKKSGSRTVLLFGGGSESLLTLGQLLDKNVKPILASFGGPAWTGYNPERNPEKFKLDQKISKDLGLELLRVRTNFRQILNPDAWLPLLKPNVSMLNTVLSLPLFLSFIYPLAEQFGIQKIVSGNEKNNKPHECFCFSPSLTASYFELAMGVSYESHLGLLYKEDVCRELYLEYPHLAKYQYSCWRNNGQRWCYSCETCLEYYALLKNFDIDPRLVGMDEIEIMRHHDRLVSAASTAPESRPGEIWPRMKESPALKSDPQMQQLMNEIKGRALVYHGLKRFYNGMPLWLQTACRAPKNLFKQGRMTRSVVHVAEPFSAPITAAS